MFILEIRQTDIVGNAKPKVEVFCINKKVLSQTIDHICSENPGLSLAGASNNDIDGRYSTLISKGKQKISMSARRLNHILDKKDAIEFTKDL